MKTQICTTIEQSKKLLALGLSPESADMYYPYDIETYPEFETELMSETAIPSWSLSALLELIPQRIYMNETVHQLQLDKSWDNKTWQCAYDAKNSYIEQKGDTPLEAVYNMITWLFENNYIKTEKI